MLFGLKYSQLMPVANGVRASIVSYNGSDPGHEAILRESLPRFLGPLNAGHGAVYSAKNIGTTVHAANTKQIKIDFVVVALEACLPIVIAALATRVDTYDVEWGERNKMKIFPIEHGEDLSVDKDVAQRFREYTKCAQYPDGIGLGTWIMREQIRRSVSNPDWVFAGRDNEHAPDNAAIIGVMDKFGAIHGAEGNPILQLDARTLIKPRFEVPVIVEALPAHGYGFGPCPYNFITRWSNDDGAQQLASVSRWVPPTSDDEGVVWTRIRSNGNLPAEPLLKDILTSMIAANREEIADRGWTVPPGAIFNPNGFTEVFSGTAAITHFAAHEQADVIKALEPEAQARMFGLKGMVSGFINPRTVPNQVATFGQALPPPTEVAAINPEAGAFTPSFGFMPTAEQNWNYAPTPYRPDKVRADNDNAASLAA